MQSQNIYQRSLSDWRSVVSKNTLVIKSVLPPNYSYFRAKLEIVTKTTISKDFNKTTTATRKNKVKINLSKLPKDKLMAHIRAYKDQILSQLKSTVNEAGRQVNTASFPNAYNVSYTGQLAKQVNDFHCYIWSILPKSISNVYIFLMFRMLTSQPNSCYVVPKRTSTSTPSPNGTNSSIN